MTVDELNGSTDADALFLRCCGSRRWARARAAARPFDGVGDVLDTADRIWHALTPLDWREAFAAHPKIGERTGDGWAAGEQAGASDASQVVRERLAEANRAYEARFGYIFIVCAAGKTADAMLAMAEERLQHDPDRELRVAVEEQRNITRLRLSKLLATT
ncbi:MAG TPA: 2-oxo-4-hydroxy-4-carboxy-5-ureidoimidazoline decarboxylase [Vicinamibacterales bacterium]|jgi:OHCU decarboxylase